jgi:hypothetical protein
MSGKLKEVAAAPKRRSFSAEFFKPQLNSSNQIRKALPQKRFVDIRNLRGAGLRAIAQHPRHGSGSDVAYQPRAATPDTELRTALGTACADDSCHDRR